MRTASSRRSFGAAGATTAALMTAMAIVIADPRAIAIAGIHAYQHALAPLAAHAGMRCRFTPSCSRYAEAVIERDGLMRGGLKSVARIARCGPWTRQGTADAP